MAQEPVLRPSIGGANLEALFAFESISLCGFRSMFDRVFRSQFELAPLNSFSAIDANYTFVELPEMAGVNEFLDWAGSRQVRTLFLNLFGTLADVNVRVSLSCDFGDYVVSIATPENMLWGFAEDAGQARFERLDAFFSLCEHACQLAVPAFAVIGSEPAHVNEVSVHNTTYKKTPFAHDVFFSESAKRELFDWYVNVYARRWEGARRIND